MVLDLPRPTLYSHPQFFLISSGMIPRHMKLLTKYSMCLRIANCFEGVRFRFGERLLFRIKIRLFLLFSLFTVYSLLIQPFFLWIRLSIINLSSNVMNGKLLVCLIGKFKRLVFQVINKLLRNNISLIFFI